MLVNRSALLLLGLFLLLCPSFGCQGAEEDCAAHPEACLVDPGGKADNTAGFLDLNLAAGKTVLYEVQARVANACHPEVGAPWQREACQAKPAPNLPYRAEGMSCGEIGKLSQIRMGTLDDMLADTADYKQGITLRYIKDRVGANAIWMMPLFPNNDTWSIPSACDNLGSPYAVRDYLHVRGSLAQSCILEGRDEHSTTPCWGNQALERLIEQAHRQGLKVMLDLALNHFGHNYLFYDYQDFTPMRDRIASGEDIHRVWNFDETFESFLLQPEILDSSEKLNALAQREPYHRRLLDALQARCPSLSGDTLVRAYNIWRVALDSERATFPCDNTYLESAAPGFYVGANHWDPSRSVGDNFSGDGYNTWQDVKFLFHHEANTSHQHEFVRLREYLFRLVNYWVSRGVDGFRLDHTTDPFSGIDTNEWKYIISKVNYYARRRGQATPIYLAEEFHDQPGMNKVVDIMTEGYVTDMAGRGGRTKDTAHVERVMENINRFGGRTYVMTALETHDEKRLMDDSGLDIWTGAGFWGIGATTWSTPMILMGQEFGESWRLDFRKSDFLRSRFEGTAQWQPEGDALRDYYQRLIKNRLDQANRALYASNYRFLRTRQEKSADPRLFAQVKWSREGGEINVVFVFHNLWKQDVSQSYFIPPDLAGELAIEDARSYRLVDVFSGQQKGSCKRGQDLKWDFYVELDARTRAQWLRLETCQ